MRLSAVGVSNAFLQTLSGGIRRSYAMRTCCTPWDQKERGTLSWSRFSGRRRVLRLALAG